LSAPTVASGPPPGLTPSRLKSFVESKTFTPAPGTFMGSNVDASISPPAQRRSPLLAVSVALLVLLGLGVTIFVGNGGRSPNSETESHKPVVAAPNPTPSATMAPQMLPALESSVTLAPTAERLDAATALNDAGAPKPKAKPPKAAPKVNPEIEGY
jgi:hypothetical protein